MTIQLTPNLAERLRVAAAAQGMEPDEYAAQALLEQIERDAAQAGEFWVVAGDAQADEALTAEDRARIRAGIEHGLQDVAAGRVTPLEAFIDEQRARHGYPDTWPDSV